MLWSVPSQDPLSPWHAWWCPPPEAQAKIGYFPTSTLTTVLKHRISFWSAMTKQKHLETQTPFETPSPQQWDLRSFYSCSYLCWWDFGVHQLGAQVSLRTLWADRSDQKREPGAAAWMHGPLDEIAALKQFGYICTTSVFWLALGLWWHMLQLPGLIEPLYQLEWQAADSCWHPSAPSQAGPALPISVCQAPPPATKGTTAD